MITLRCTNPSFYGCERRGSESYILNPIRSASIRTLTSFAFKYGRMEVNAQIPEGDWLWPAISLMPKRNEYGTWPVSGEIDLLESRGNLNLIKNGVNIGVEQVSQTLHFGPYPSLNGHAQTTFFQNSLPGNGFNREFHRYHIEWTPDYIRFSIDDIETATVPAGFWARGLFEQKAPGTENPWRLASKMAPFDQEFYVIINLAIGGISHFPDDAKNAGGKQWLNSSPRSAHEFWNGRNAWLPTWKLDINSSEVTSFKVDYVRIWAL